jgi:arsenite methyltransferase
MVVITSFQRDLILDAVRTMYTDVANHPERTFHFPTGRAACELVGYPQALLDPLPAAVIESFAGVGYPFAAQAIHAGDTVLDIGSGSGTDVFVARSFVGEGGRVIGLDMTQAMREKLRRTAAAAHARNIEVIDGNAEEIPLPDASVDVVTSNGVLNLVPNKVAAVAEICRVLRPGGRVQIADIVLVRPASSACQANAQLWAECIVGATTEDDYLALFASEGLENVSVLRRLDYFAASASAETRTVAESFGAQAVVFAATKPA